MSRFSHIIFDLDGTLTDNTRGIGNSLHYALSKMGIEGFDGNVPDGFIGPPLQEGFKRFFGIDGRDTQRMVDFFRAYYSVHGLYENDPYPGVLEMLKVLSGRGSLLFIATSKLEKYAWQICQHFDFDRYVTRLIGADPRGEQATKTQIISRLLESRQLKSSGNIVMVGDTCWDIEGGRSNGLTTVAVTYGFGKLETLEKANPDYLAHTVEELFAWLSQ